MNFLSRIFKSFKEYNVLRTIFFNFKVFPIKTACKLPIKVGYRTQIVGAYRGCFSFAEGNPAKIISKGYKRILNTELERTVKDMFKISGERSIVVKYSDDCITLNGVSYKKLFER